MERVLLLSCLLVILVSVTSAANPSFVILAPKVIRNGIPVDISVSIIRSNGSVAVSTSIKYNKTTIATTRETFNSGDTRIMVIQMPIQDLTRSTALYTLTVEGSGSLVFQNTSKVEFSKQSKATFVQTDKAMYKPGQKVLFRTFSIKPSMKPTIGPVDITILDSKGNRIKEMKGKQSPSGVVSGDLQLSQYAMLGNWTIRVVNSGEKTDKIFEVAEYVLPKFEVKVNLPNFLVDPSTLRGTVEAKYTYGKPVKGLASVKINFPQNRLGYTKTYDVKLNDQGSGEFSITAREMYRLYDYKTRYRWHVQLVTNATVTELLTGMKQTGLSAVNIHNYEYKLEFLKVASDIFKPGMNFTTFVKLTHPDGTLLDNYSGKMTSIEIGISTNEYKPAQNSRGQTYMRYRINRKQSYSIAPTGVAVVVVSIPQNASSLSFTATLVGNMAVKQGSLYVSNAFESRSNESLQLTLLNTDKVLQVGGNIEVMVATSSSVADIFYQIIARGTIAHTVKVSGVQGAVNRRVVVIPVTEEMAPSARIVVQYITRDGEIIADVIKINVNGAFKNKVSLKFKNATTSHAVKGEPGTNITLEVTADPNSFVGLLAVDQSVMLLKSGNDIEQSQVIEEIKKFDVKPSTRPSWPPRIMFKRRRNRMIWCPGCWSSDKTSYDVINNAGFLIFTDAYIKRPDPQVYPEDGMVFALGRPGPVANAGALPDAVLEKKTTQPQASNLKIVTAVRSNFPETWIWQNYTLGYSSNLTLLTLQSSITWTRKLQMSLLHHFH